MTPSEILEGLVPGHPRREEAAHALIALLQELARGYLVETYTRESWHIPEHERDDMVQGVLEAVIARSSSGPMPVSANGDAASKRYLESMLVNRWIDAQRRKKVELSYEEQVRSANVSSNPPVSEGRSAEQVQREAMRLLQLAFDEALRTRERQRDALEGAWRDLCWITVGDGSMDQLLEREGGGAAAPDDQRVRVRDRILQAHKRCRDAILRGIDSLERSGGLSAEDAALARELVTQWLVRRRTRGVR